MNMIIHHPNYTGLPIVVENGSPKWIATAQCAIGKQRKVWAEEKALAMGIPLAPGVYAKVMLAVHPTKQKVCQICGEPMSLYYVYPNAPFRKTLISLFDIEVGVYDSLADVWNTIIGSGATTGQIVQVINTKFGTAFTASDSKDAIIAECEALCRSGKKAHLGPGAMSNFPDRFDGFHTYNRCHRSLEDKGRSAENLKSYTRDRRAYEYWSDGNVLAANQFMGSGYFKGTSADHVGPISLGFVHDPRYLRPMPGGDNSAKRDRLTADIITDVLLIQKTTGVYPMSWYSAIVWDYIVENYRAYPQLIETTYRSLLKKSMANTMYVFKTILDIGPTGEEFLIRSFIAPKKPDFALKYQFDELGNITGTSARNITGRADGEFDRYARIALDAVVLYSEKSNRNVSPELTVDELDRLRQILAHVQQGDVQALPELKALIQSMQRRLIGK